MLHADRLSPALQNLQRHLDAMPPVAAMRIAVAGLDERGLCLRAPLEANVNDKRNAFGGSLASLMTLAGWSWLNLHLQAAGEVADIYVADSQLRYLAPVYEDLVACAAPAEGQSGDAFLATLRQRGKARITVQAQVTLQSGVVAASFSGRFVALAKRE
ncbi:MAG: YiiD C-terminal domain-containing protein [Gammaproteobacteria bacterium]|uniref:YiiD C-terminal domain-containing protein n=1 Tax=Gammaproteobacteria TaxID=1236 RepID=UPI001C49B612|nr:YiiD C-terminal domain-containing protein [Pseudomonas sp. Hp2]